MIHKIKIVSGGQSGVDRAALDFALKYGIACGGWCPKNRKAEDGQIDKIYPLKEAPDTTYETRTKLNVQESDATLILFYGEMDKGTRLTIDLAFQFDKLVLIIDLFEEKKENLQKLTNWLNISDLKILNIAGPRESSSVGIYSLVMRFLDELLVN